MKTAWKAVLLAGALSSLAFGAEVDRREARQQGRIAEGVESGQLTPHETAKLERKEGRIENEIARDRAANGGGAPPAEEATNHRQQDPVGRPIQPQEPAA